MIGETISHYKITEKLGEGGMGVVYKAEDTKLERTVALKFLAAHLLNDGEAKQRFLREAKAAAALSHPNICHVYEIDESDGRTFISMEFVQGETLEDRIAKGPLSLKDALEIGRQVADGLDAAHEKGIVHRDIKPANILLDAKGRATIMDFGLARLTEASRLTKADQTMGTVAYMSPEQVQGMEVDHRSDIWALGCVLYEMVCGQKPFKGVYDKALLYEIVHQQPEPLTGLRTGVPIELEFLTSKCLAKDAADRYQHGSEAAVDLRTLAEKLKSGRSTILRPANMTAGIPATLTAGRTISPIETLPPDALVVRRRSQRALQALAAVATLVALALALVHFTQAPPEKPVRRFSFTPADPIQGNATISPDGKFILYRTGAGARTSLWLRSLSNESARELPGTEGAAGGFWSPDSLSIGFRAGRDLKRVSIDGGDPIRLCELPSQLAGGSLTGGTWSPNGERIVFSSGQRLYEIPARGGEPELLFDPGDSPRAASIHPHFLPADGGSQRLVYVAAARPADQMLAVLDLGTGERHELGPGSRPVYSSDGYLIHGPADGREPGLRALPFSLETLQPTGSSFPIDEAGAGASVSRDGTLVYTDSATSAVSGQMVVRNRSGEILRTVGGRITRGDAPAISPDGRRVAVNTQDDIWVYDLDRDLGTRLTSRAGNERVPAWVASGRELSYALDLIGLATQVADGSVEAKVLFDTPGGLNFFGWSRDDRYVAYTAAADPAGGEGGIWYRERVADGSLSEPASFLRTPAQENMPAFSPDGRYLAYRSDESGRYEVYVRPFPPSPGKWQVSTNGGSQPRWSAHGKEIFYAEGSTLMAVVVSTGGSFTVGPPQRLFESGDLKQSAEAVVRYDVFPDGQRFVTLSPAEGDTPPSIRIVENWFEEFRDQERN